MKKYLLAGGIASALILGACSEEDMAALEESANELEEEVTEEEVAEAETTEETTSEESEEPTEEVTEEANEPEEETQDDVPSEWQAALNSAETYADIMNMSRQGIYDQLTSEAGDNFPDEAAQYAYDNIEYDWNDNALKSAQNYQEMMDMSHNAIYDQLIFEKFTPEEAQYAVDNLE